MLWHGHATTDARPPRDPLRHETSTSTPPKRGHVCAISTRLQARTVAIALRILTICSLSRSMGNQLRVLTRTDGRLERVAVLAAGLVLSVVDSLRIGWN